MKGLLLKDFYMTIKYCKIYLLMAAVFLAISCVGNTNMVFAFFPIILCGMIPINLLTYDEQSRWLQYSCTLPYTKTQIVSSKYLFGLLCPFGMAGIVAVFYMIQMGIGDSLRIDELGGVSLIALVLSSFMSSVILPFAFMLGTEKGRVVCYFLVGLLYAIGSIVLSVAMVFQKSPHGIIGIDRTIVLCLVGVIVLYILSWRLSIALLKRREMF